MRVVRPVLALALVGGLAATTGVSAAAPKKPKPKPVPPVCNLITDDKGDGVGFVTNDEPGLDILSGDLATSKGAVTAELRLGGDPLAFGDLNAPMGASFYVSFVAPGAEFPVFVSATTGASGTTFNYGTVEPSANGVTYTSQGTATGAITGSTVRMSVDTATLSAFASVKPGMKLTDLAAMTTTPVGTTPLVGAGASLLYTADEATGTKPYTAGAASCVKP